MTIPIVEIFNSIEGEGARTGLLCTFIRTAGCNLRCSFCDTTYSYEGGTPMELREILSEVDRLECKTITITGGEPLLHSEVCDCLIPWLLDRGYDINVETNGSLDITKVVRHRYDKLIFTIDWKSPSSGMNAQMHAANLTNATEKDVVKFVVGSNEDLNEMLRVLQTYSIKANIYVSPVFGAIQMSTIVDFMKANKLYGVKLQCQLHKIIWDPNERGV